MITIKRNGKEFKIPNDDFVAVQDSSDGLYFKFKDTTELRMNIELTPQIRAIPDILMRATSKNIILDFNSKNIIQICG